MKCSLLWYIQFWGIWYIQLMKRKFKSKTLTVSVEKQQWGGGGKNSPNWYWLYNNFCNQCLMFNNQETMWHQPHRYRPFLSTVQELFKMYVRVPWKLFEESRLSVTLAYGKSLQDWGGIFSIHTEAGWLSPKEQVKKLLKLVVVVVGGGARNQIQESTFWLS